MALNKIVGAKGDKNSRLRLLLPQGLVERSTDAQTCEILFVGAVLTLEKTMKTKKDKNLNTPVRE